MKKKFKLLIIILSAFIFLPNNVKAYNTLNLKEVLAEEEITESFENYKESSDAITIYLFRGKGCGYCRAFLEFLNSITTEYGKYFKLVSYEVWNNSDNAKLMDDVSNYLEKPASGVPYIIIGDKVFAGYADSYNDQIKEAITDLYKTKKNKRYDVFKEMKKISLKKIISDNSNIIIISLISILIIISYINLKFKELKIEINKISEITNKKQNRKEGK